jgi:endoglucanase
VVVPASQFVCQADGTFKATLTITPDDSPNFKAMATDPDKSGSTLTNMILLVGAQGSDVVLLDNITVAGRRLRLWYRTRRSVR